MKIQIGDTVVLPESFPEFPKPGHRALVIDRDGDDWILELNQDPDPPDGDSEMLWPDAKREELGVVRTVEVVVYGDQASLAAAAWRVTDLVDAQWDNSWIDEHEYDLQGEVARIARDVIDQLA